MWMLLLYRINNHFFLLQLHFHAFSWSGVHSVSWHWSFHYCVVAFMMVYYSDTKEVKKDLCLTLNFFFFISFGLRFFPDCHPWSGCRNGGTSREAPPGLRGENELSVWHPSSFLYRSILRWVSQVSNVGSYLGLSRPPRAQRKRSLG